MKATPRRNPRKYRDYGDHKNHAAVSRGFVAGAAGFERARFCSSRHWFEADDFMAFVEKTASHVKTYEAGAAGDENTHCSSVRGQEV
jgi:hypothetical protein